MNTGLWEMGSGLTGRPWRTHACARNVAHR